jgi:hypothetical protein
MTIGWEVAVPAILATWLLLYLAQRAAQGSQRRTLCIDCAHLDPESQDEPPESRWMCAAPMFTEVNFLTGGPRSQRLCSCINTKGKCPGFKAKARRPHPCNREILIWPHAWIKKRKGAKP